MPQRASRLPLFAGLQREATKALAALRQEIAQRERELATLKAEAARWQSVMQEPASRVSPAITPSRLLPSKRPRLDWGRVLQELPTRFSTQDVAQKSGKPLGHIYVHVSRWRKDKKVRRVKEGYQKV